MIKGKTESFSLNLMKFCSKKEYSDNKYGAKTNRISFSTALAALAEGQKLKTRERFKLWLHFQEFLIKQINHYVPEEY